jgi:hypothetical protein
MQPVAIVVYLLPQGQLLAPLSQGGNAQEPEIFVVMNAPVIRG